ncbi:MAG TPA: hypothetical protein VHY19_06920 [Steroidobacteraceae bacterium]|jgi:hypothetical protein|nr:hypothetical protein [Steroidobacteraceae bacterium]
MDTNPPEDDSWWYRLLEERKVDDEDAGSVESFKQPSDARRQPRIGLTSRRTTTRTSL